MDTPVTSVPLPEKPVEMRLDPSQDGPTMTAGKGEDRESFVDFAEAVRHVLSTGQRVWLNNLNPTAVPWLNLVRLPELARSGGKGLARADELRVVTGVAVDKRTMTMRQTISLAKPDPTVENW